MGDKLNLVDMFEINSCQQNSWQNELGLDIFQINRCKQNGWQNELGRYVLDK